MYYVGTSAEGIWFLRGAAAATADLVHIATPDNVPYAHVWPTQEGYPIPVQVGYPIPGSTAVGVSRIHTPVSLQ